MIVRRLNEHFMRIKKQNPKGYLDSFEMQLDKYMFEVAQELNLKISIGPDGHMYWPMTSAVKRVRE